jgi:hypothetical protein
MIRSYDEKRDFLRMAVNAEAHYRLAEGGQLRRATVRDLSARGMLLEVDEAHDADTRLAVVVPPGKAGTEPLVAEGRVLRCEPGGEGYRVALVIERLA